MKCLTLLPAALLGFMSVPTSACEQPPLVQIPAGASDDEALREAVADYFAAMQLYTDCIKAELEAAGNETAPPLKRTLLVRRNNVAVAEVQSVIDLYNAATGAGDEGPPAPAQAPDEEQDERGRRRNR